MFRIEREWSRRKIRTLYYLGIIYIWLVFGILLDNLLDVIELSNRKKGVF